VAIRITYSEAERELAAAQPVNLSTITARLADCAWMVSSPSDFEARMNLADGCDELEHRERTGRWSERADASPPSCVRGAVEVVNRLIAARRR
jgi:hypothetical protein